MLDINVKDVSLVLEGGTFRTVFTMGILDAFLDAGIMMPHISGVSAGITYAGSYISQQKGRNIQILKKYRHDKRYMGMRNFLTDRSIFGLKFAYDTLVNELEPMDWETFRAYKGCRCDECPGRTDQLYGWYEDGQELQDAPGNLCHSDAFSGNRDRWTVLL